jgi:hypothetical protein
MRVKIVLAACLGLICVSCSTSRDVTADQRYNLQNLSPNAILVLRQPCWFIDNPGVDDLIPVEGRKLSDWDQEHKTGVIPAGTQIKFLGVRAESGYMADTRIRKYGRLVDGTFKGRRVSLDRLIGEQDKTPIFYSTAKE